MTATSTSPTPPTSMPPAPQLRDPVADLLRKEAADHCDTLPGLLEEFHEYVRLLDEESGTYLIRGGRRLQINPEEASFRITNPPPSGFVTLRDKAEGQGALALTTVLMEILKNQSDNRRCFQDAMAWIRLHYPHVAAYTPTKEEVATRRAEVERERQAEKARHQHESEAWRQRVQGLDTVGLLAAMGYTEYTKDSARQWHFKIDDHTVNVRVDGSPGFAFGVLPGSPRTNFASCRGKGGSRGNLALVKLVMEIKGHGSDEQSCYEAARNWLNQTYPELNADVPLPPSGGSFALRPSTVAPAVKETDVPLSADRIPAPRRGDAVDQTCREYLARRGLDPDVIDTFYHEGFFHSATSLHKASDGPVLCSPIRGWETGTTVGMAIKPAGGQGGKGRCSKGINEGRAARGGIIFGDPERAGTVFLTEAAVDVASLYQIRRDMYPDAAYVAMTGARIPGPDHIDAFFKFFPNARTYIGAFNNDYVGRQASAALAAAAEQRGFYGRVDVPEGGEFAIDVSTRGPSGIGERLLHELIGWATANQVPLGIPSRAEDRAARRNRIAGSFEEKEIPTQNLDEADWQTIHIANTPESCELVHRLTREAREARAALPEELRRHYPKEFSAHPLNKDWNDILRGGFKPVAARVPWLPVCTTEESRAAVNVLYRAKSVDQELAAKLVSARLFYPHRISGQPPRVAMITPLADFDTGRPVGFVAENVPTTDAPVMRARIYGAANHGAATLRHFDANTKRLILTSSFESAVGKLQLEPKDQSVCIMGYVGDKVPERLLELCRARGIDLTVALDATPQGRALGDQIVKRAREMGIPSDKLLRDEPPSAIVFGFPPTPEGHERRDRARETLSRHKHTVRELPVRDGIIRISTENTRQAEALVTGDGSKPKDPGTKTEQSEPAAKPAPAAEGKIDVTERSKDSATTVEFLGTSWSHHAYLRRFDRDFARTGKAPEPVGQTKPRDNTPETEEELARRRLPHSPETSDFDR